MVGRNNANHRERVMAPLEAQLGLSDVTYIPHTDLDGCARSSPQPTSSSSPSRFDNSPMTIFEALSSGVSVITSDRVGTSSWIEPENGLLTLPIDDPALFGRPGGRAAIADPEWMASGDRAAAARIRETVRPRGGHRAACWTATPASWPSAASPCRRPRAAEEIEATPEEIAETARRLAEAVGGSAVPRLEGARTHAVLSFADEVVADPSLLAGWSRCVRRLRRHHAGHLRAGLEPGACG